MSRLHTYTFPYNISIILNHLQNLVCEVHSTSSNLTKPHSNNLVPTEPLTAQICPGHGLIWIYADEYVYMYIINNHIFTYFLWS